MDGDEVSPMQTPLVRPDYWIDTRTMVARGQAVTVALRGAWAHSPDATMVRSWAARVALATARGEADVETAARALRSSYREET